jgi:hypothetical protein
MARGSLSSALRRLAGAVSLDDSEQQRFQTIRPDGRRSIVSRKQDESKRINLRVKQGSLRKINKSQLKTVKNVACSSLTGKELFW